MATTRDFFELQANDCAKAAEQTNLPNQRETFLRAELAWRALANRETENQQAREQREAEKAQIAEAASDPSGIN